MTTSPAPRPTTVLKLGGSVLRNEAALPAAAAEVARWSRRGPLLVVVSALGHVTDSLLERAAALGPEASPASLAALLATGETQAVSLLGLALAQIGIGHSVLDPLRVGPEASGPLLDAWPTGLDVDAVRTALDRDRPALMAGFVARARDGRPCLLGRGGSDLSAVFAAHRLDAERCRLVKDVDGIFDGDPTESAGMRRFEELGYGDALALGTWAVQPKALRYAARHRVRLEVGLLGSDGGTLIGPMRSVLVPG